MVVVVVFFSFFGYVILKVLLKEGKENESLVCVFWVCFRSGRGVVEPDLNL